MSKFKVGDYVRDEDGFKGEVKSLFTEEQDGETVDMVNVLWDQNNQTEVACAGDLELHDDSLEVAFKKVCDDHMKEIDEQLEIAREAITKAEKLSEKYGLPFSAGVSPLGQSYFPATFSKKFPSLDTEFVSDITGAYSEYFGECAGWEHSAIC